VTQHEELESLSTPFDKRRAGKGFPGEGHARDRDRGEYTPGRAVLWNATEVADFAPAPVWGAFPVGFAGYAIKSLLCHPSEVLHLCSGMLTASEVRGGFRIDLRAAARPDVRADARSLPFRDGSWSGVLIDPPLFGRIRTRALQHGLSQAGSSVGRGLAGAASRRPRRFPALPGPDGRTLPPAFRVHARRYAGLRLPDPGLHGLREARGRSFWRVA